MTRFTLAGGPQTTTGRDMLTTYKGVNVSEQELAASVDDIVAEMGMDELDA